ncbi:MAG: YbaB/EbfC family nucleoid-associated protein [Bacteroidetes bacterium]|nr:YbaB/EbfC family nucleoid-associated protein [Rhodothermia bacterium]MCS7154584.1 YbaB/EbfC family nucleoid-associated protein [Bacteroidota bacterium]MCX7906301.1 YbaB/EbfC family nucleoid-associated protein [Bacteroidota bacterium]MDW8137377.1 YbaB/EbfC family nucleoid-associated protein [Bacteroidota bacterium]MDW8285669.1 YbaB/EbfC family nucleoid-associated protein [Bacteroidota bacterium]
MLNLADLFGKLQELQQRVATLEAELERKTTSVEVGGGLVQITASASGRIVRIQIEPSALNLEEREVLEDLLVAGVNKALEEARRLAQEEMSRITAGLLPPGFRLPGW